MTSVLVVIEPHRTLAEAQALMRRHSIRHLPVVELGRIAGLLSQRDVYLVETLRDVDPHEAEVAEAMSADIFLVDADAPLELVAREMADRRLGSAIVAREGKPLGIFTTTDALRALAVLAAEG